MTAQERRARFTEHIAHVAKVIFLAETRVNKDPGVTQRLADDSLTADEYVQLVAEEIADNTRDEVIAAFFNERSADE